MRQYPQTFLCLSVFLCLSNATVAGSDCRGAIDFYEQNLTYFEVAVSELNFPKADTEVTADFLVQTSISKDNDNATFKTAMKKTIAKIISQIKIKIGKERITKEDVKKWFDSIAKDRWQLAKEQKKEDAYKYGQTTNRQGLVFVVDNIINDKDYGHYYVFDRISKFFETQQTRDSETNTRTIKIDFNKKSYYIHLAVIRQQNQNWYQVRHFIEQYPIPLAYEMFAHILNNKDFYGKNLSLLNLRLSQAVFILMHHTPWTRGTPSIVESMVEAVLRVAFGLTHPPKKTSENFWDAMIGIPLGTLKDPPKKKGWAFFKIFRKKEPEQQKPEVFEYGNAWGRRGE